MDPTSESFEKLREIFHGKKLPTDALESLCGVTPHSCRYCREHFALDFSDQELGAKSIENRKRAELEPSFDNSLGEYKFLNVAYEDLAVGVKMGCPLCAQWSAYITENDITAYKFAPRFRKQWDTYAGFDMCPSLGEEGKLDYGVTVTHESPFAYKAFVRPFNHTPGSSSSLSKARDWLQNCRHLHDLCQPVTSLARPRYLIHIYTTAAGHFIKLMEGCNLVSPDYAALSYCWGDEQDSLIKTTIATLQEHRTGISFYSLPRTIQDAVVVTSALHLSYLWCDSLCIVQDDEAQMDEEISSMGDIYAGATVTIAASRAERAQDGFLGPRVIPGWNTSTVFNLPCFTESGKSACLTLSPPFEKLPEPLNSRAWALQEQILSSRVLSFGLYETRWICKHCEESDIIFGDADECDHHDAENMWRGRAHRYDLERESQISHYVTGQPSSAGADPQAASLWNSEDDDSLFDVTTEAHGEWQKLVMDYTRRKLTNGEDRLPAIAGIASKCQSVIGCRYYAGLWETYIFRDLLWKVSTYVTEILPRPSKYQAPSWSWAATNSHVTFCYSASDSVAHEDFQMNSCEIVTARTESHFGSVSNGYIVITGRVRLATLYTLKPWNSHPRTFALNFLKEGNEIRLLARIYCDAAEPDPTNSDVGAMTVTLLLVSGPQNNEMWGGNFCRGLCLRRMSSGSYRRVGVFETMPGVDRSSLQEMIDEMRIDRDKVHSEHNLWLSTGLVQTVTVV